MMLPTFAPQAVFWAPNFDLLNLSVGESRERFYQFSLLLRCQRRTIPERVE
jgi:hypothetical protein